MCVCVCVCVCVQVFPGQPVQGHGAPTGLSSDGGRPGRGGQDSPAEGGGPAASD